MVKAKIIVLTIILSLIFSLVFIQVSFAQDYDLSDYPKPFIDVNARKFDYLGVVGVDATSIDNLALTDIIVTLSGVEVEGVAISNFDKAPDALLDTEVAYPTNHNLILIGGPAVNRLSAQFLGKTYPTYGEDSGLKEGEAKLILKDNGDKVALIVTGWSGEDVRRAAKVLQYYDVFTSALKGREVIVVGTTANPTIVTRIIEPISNEEISTTTLTTLKVSDLKKSTRSNIFTSKFFLYSIISIFAIILIMFLIKYKNKLKLPIKHEKKIVPTIEHKEEKKGISHEISEAIIVRNFTVKHKSNIILDKVDLKIKRGTFVSIVGSSGAGKSTILEAIVGRKEYSSGDITIFGKDPNKNGDVYQYVGFVPQHHEIYMNQTVEQNLITSATKWGIKDVKKKLDDILYKINLTNRRELKANKLSGGQIKLLSLGMELIRDPELLVLDEPTTGLDPNTRNQIITILSNIVSKDNKTVLITTHFMDDAEECDEVIIVGNKKILAQDSPSKLEKRLPGGGRIVNIVLDNITDNLLKNIERLPNVEKIIREGRSLNILTNDPDTIEFGRKIKEAGGIVNEIKITKATMKEVFVYFTGEDIKE